MELDGDIQVGKEEASFKFKEQLMFNIPILKPKVPLTGKLILKRGEDGLITSYREIWDQPVSLAGADLRKLLLRDACDQISTGGVGNEDEGVCMWEIKS
eukprot:767219-Hanusia_phi.AAC.2